MQSIEVFFYATEIIGFICAGVIYYGKLTAKNKELEMLVRGLQDKMQIQDKQDDRIISKLDNITDKLNSIEIQMQNKQDRH